MDRVSAEATDTTESLRSRRQRWAWITIATIGVVSASAIVAVPAIAENDDPPSHDRVIVCDSGVETNGDIQMSAATATRVADGDTTPAPEGCREG